MSVVVYADFVNKETMMRRKDHDLDALLAVPIEQRAYMAGFFDGEGHISIARRGEIRTSRVDPTLRRRVYSIVCGAAQNHREPLVLFHEVFGGTLRLDTRKRAGYSPREHEMWEWSIGGNSQCPVFLQWLMPHLIVKRWQAEIAMEFAKVANVVSEDEFELYQTRMRYARRQLEHPMTMSA